MREKVKFKFTDQPHTSKINVWYDKIFIGEIFVTMKERDDIDWNKYRADKTLRMTVQERYDMNYVPSIKIDGTASRVLGTYQDKEAAAEAMLAAHRGHYNAC